MSLENALAARYIEAWQSRDADAVVALHSRRSVFTSVVAPHPAVGLDSIR
jgi:hypothetical protein